MKRYLKPLGWLIVTSLVLLLIRNYVHFDGVNTFYNIVAALLLFVFGTSMCEYHKTRGDTWLKKMIIMFLFVVTILLHLQVINIPVVNSVLETIGVTSLVYRLLFIYFGYIFFL